LRVVGGLLRSMAVECYHINSNEIQQNELILKHLLKHR